MSSTLSISVSNELGNAQQTATVATSKQQSKAASSSSQETTAYSYSSTAARTSTASPHAVTADSK